MGNHTAGALINNFAVQFAKDRRPNETAIEILDRAVKAAKASPGFSPDCEFEASDPYNPGMKHPLIDEWRDPTPAAILGMLMVEAFAPNGLRDLPRYAMMGLPKRWKDIPAAQKAHEDAVDAWWEEVNEPFRKRYGLC